MSAIPLMDSVSLVWFIGVWAGYTWYADRATSGDERWSGARELALHLSAIIDIFDRAFDEDRTPLDEDEWELVRSLVNAASPEIDMGTLEYVMQVLMDHGALG